MFENIKWLRRLDDILDRIAMIEKALEGKDFSAFEQDEILIAAIERHFSVIGEAVNFIPDDVKKRFLNVPWQEMYAMRNIIVHGYDDVSYAVLWDTVINDLSALKRDIVAIKKEFQEPDHG